ncbi:MAG: TIGR03085 family metal-binding protein [Acidimicrobiales bacterium]|jgi:uncharacterized protein (TIGR03085 family)
MSGSHLASVERKRFCDALAETGPDAATLCEGWMTRDLAAHVFVREHRPLAMPGILLGGRFARLTEGSMTTALYTYGYAGVVAKVRSGPPLLWRPLDGLVNLVELFVHTEDVRRAQPGWEPGEDPELDAALWRILERLSRMLARKIRGAGLELERSDGKRIIARKGGSSAVLTGGAQELVLFLYGRGQAARVSLTGPEEAQRLVRETHFGF